LKEFKIFFGKRGNELPRGKFERETLIELIYVMVLLWFPTSFNLQDDSSQA